MVDKNVNLVIRGKDQGGSKVVEAVTAAINEFKQAQAELGKSTSQTDGVLGELGQEFRRLNSEVTKLGAISKISAELDKAGAAVRRLQDETRTTATEFARIARDTEQASVATARLRGEAEALTKTYEEQRQATAAAKKEQTDANAVLRKTTSAYDALQRKLAANVVQNGRGSAIVSAGTFLAADLEKAKQAAADAAQAYQRLKTEQDATKTSLGGLNEQIKAAASNETRLRAQADQLAAATKTQKTALTQSRAELDQMTTSAAEAGVAIGKVAGDELALAAASKSAADDLERTQRTLKAMQQFSTGGGTFTDPKTAAALQQQRAEVEKSRVTWKTLEDEVRRLAIAMAATAEPTQQQTASFNQVTAAARAAKQEFLSQRDALAALQGSVRSSYSEWAKGVGIAQQLRTEVKGAGNEASNAGQKFNLLRSFMQAFGNDTRKSMSLVQRIRGEILSLAAANLGLYAAIGQIGGVITAYRALEAAQNRLGVVFHQNQEVVRTELSWLEREAARLGISFQVLSDEYSKFAVAANAANFSAQATREIFISVAEAGRVNKLSLDEMSGVFLALTQMISKGKVSAEELRRQLGDRLAGAFNIFADALGVSTAQLDQMMRQGEVLANETNLLKFADELRKRFGPQLADALKSTTTLLGQWDNTLFQAQLRVARGGFIDGLNKGLASLNKWFESREGRDFFLSIGAALGKLVSALATVPEHFDQIAFAVRALITLKLAQWAAGVFQSMMQVSAGARAEAAALLVANGSILTYAQAKVRLQAIIASALASLSAFRASVVATATGMTVASVGTVAWTAALGTLRGVMITVAAVARGLWVAIGGPVGLIVAAITFIATDLLGQWAGGVDQTTAALDEHERIMGEVLKAYEAVTDKTKDWQKEIKNVTLDQVNVDVRKMRDAFAQAKNDVIAFKHTNIDVVLSGGVFGSVQKEIEQARDAFTSGKTSAAEFRAKLEELYRSTDSDALQKFIEELLVVARKAEDSQKALNDAAVVAKSMGSTLNGLDQDISDTSTTLDTLTGSVDDTTAGLDKGIEKLNAYTAALDSLKDKVPLLSDELKKAQDLAQIDADFKKAADNAQSFGQIQQAFDIAQAARLAVLLRGVSDSVQASAKLIIAKEGFTATPKVDTDGKQRIGFGSDTVTLSDGSVQKVVDGMVIGYEDATRDLVRRIEEFQGIIKRQIGADRFEAFTPEAQAALTSIAYNYGQLPERIVGAVKTGSAQQIADAVRGLADDNGGINRDRRNSEADILARGGEGLTQSNFEIQQQITEELDKQRQLTLDALSDAEFELEQNKLIEAGKGRQAAIEEAIRSARKQNANITDEEVAKFAKLAAEQYDLAHATDAMKAAEEDVNRLVELRTELLNQIKVAQDQGDVLKAEDLKKQLAGVNEQLTVAIDKAIVFIKAMGGPDMDLLLAKMEGLKNATADVGTTAIVTGDQINTSLASGLVNALDKFASLWHDGEDAISSARDAFLGFASDFLLEIAKMIAQQAILNLLQAGAGAGGGIGGAIAGFIGSLFHDGGIAGAGGARRAMSPSWLQNAYRYHMGGIAGLKPGEVPAVLKVGEEILTQDNPRHIANGGGGQSTKVVNLFDSGSFLSEALNSKVGEKAILNWVRANPAAFRAALGS